MSAPARISVLIPTYRHAAFIARALDSLLGQDEKRWQAVIIDDCSPDDTAEIVRPYLTDPRFEYHRSATNQGLGAALNRGLSISTAPYIAYLPSDDVYYADHLRSLLDLLENDRDAVLAYSGVRHHHFQYSDGQIEGLPLQLVQVLHRRTNDRWIERQDLVTDDLEAMFWSSLRQYGAPLRTEEITGEWVDHRDQLHKLIRQRSGGLNVFRARYHVPHPMRYHPSDADPFDEVEHYRRFRDRPQTPRSADSLKILMVGELAYNPERVLALEERGHKLYGLWTPDPWWFNTVGPMPFGHVEDLPHKGWQEAVSRIQPDVIYALLNWQAVPFVHQVLMENPGIPFVWHLKEGPLQCFEVGTWPLLVDLQLRSDAQIYATRELCDWFATALPPSSTSGHPVMILDGDLPKREWLAGARRPRLSDADGEIHTVVSGRAMGIHLETVVELAKRKIHTHFYGLSLIPEWFDEAKRQAGRFVHAHGAVHQDKWVSEFSQYDAGWLHVFDSRNGGDIRRATWDDLNCPARVGTLLAAGLPLLQRDNSGSIVATQSLAKRLDIGVFFSDLDDLHNQLQDRDLMARLRQNVWSSRQQFTFDYYADALIDFFRGVIASRPQASGSSPAALAPLLARGGGEDIDENPTAAD